MGTERARRKIVLIVLIVLLVEKSFRTRSSNSKIPKEIFNKIMLSCSIRKVQSISDLLNNARTLEDHTKVSTCATDCTKGSVPITQLRTVRTTESTKLG